MRSALWRAAVPPRSNTPPGPYWLVVATTTPPVRTRAAARAVSITRHGTDKTTTSAAAASAGSPTVPPISAASAASRVWSRAKLTVTSWPARASRRARLPPMFPAPMMPTRIASPTQRLDDQLCGLAAAEILPAGDQTPGKDDGDPLGPVGVERLEFPVAHVWRSRSCTILIAIDPSPTATETRLVDLARASPTASSVLQTRVAESPRTRLGGWFRAGGAGADPGGHRPVCRRP